MKRKPPDQSPESGDQKPAQAGSAEVGRLTGKTTTGTPRPAARAREAQEPDPAPEKQREGEEEGRTPGGQVEETNPTSPAPGPEEATAETRAAERRAKEERPEPNDEARKMDAEGAAERTRASAPVAQPTATPRPERRTEWTTQETSADDEAGNDREPQKPIRPVTTTSREPSTPPVPHRTGRLAAAPTAQGAYGRTCAGTKGAQGAGPERFCVANPEGGHPGRAFGCPCEDGCRCYAVAPSRSVLRLWFREDVSLSGRVEPTRRGAG